MRKIRIDKPHQSYETTLGFLVKYKSSEGYQRTLEHYAEKVNEGWEFGGNFFPSSRRLNLSSLDTRVKDLSKIHEVYVGEVAFNPDGSIMKNGRVIFIKAKIRELAD